MAEQQQLGTPGAPAPQRFNFTGQLDCPICYRPGSLVRMAGGFHECAAKLKDSCGAVFRYIPATPHFAATLERVRVDSAWNAGARVADDLRCFGCGERGVRHLCSTCQRDYNQAGR